MESPRAEQRRDPQPSEASRHRDGAARRTIAPSSSAASRRRGSPDREDTDRADVRQMATGDHRRPATDSPKLRGRPDRGGMRGGLLTGDLPVSNRRRPRIARGRPRMNAEAAQQGRGRRSPRLSTSASRAIGRQLEDRAVQRAHAGLTPPARRIGTPQRRLAQPTRPRCRRRVRSGVRDRRALAGGKGRLPTGRERPRHPASPQSVLSSVERTAIDEITVTTRARGRLRPGRRRWTLAN